jgi:hypothetical protein
MRDDESAPRDIARMIEDIDGTFKTKAAARKFAEKCGFVPTIKWGEMNL